MWKKTRSVVDRLNYVGARNEAERVKGKQSKTGLLEPNRNRFREGLEW